MDAMAFTDNMTSDNHLKVADQEKKAAQKTVSTEPKVYSETEALAAL